MLNAPRKAYTVYASTSDLRSVPQTARTVDPAVDLETDGDPWLRIVIHTAGSSLSITHRERIERGDEFSNLILGTWNYFRGLDLGMSEQDKGALLRRITETRSMLGIIAQPCVREEHLPFIRAIANVTGGLIFYGSDMLDPDDLTRVE